MELSSIQRELLGALAQRVEPGSVVLRSWALKGGVSAEVTAFEIERLDGGTEKLILRRHGTADRGRNPQLAADEFRLLRLLESAGVAAPRPRYLDAVGEIFPTPSLVVEYVDGDVARASGETEFVVQLAAALAEIHAVGDAATLPFLPQRVEIPAGPEERTRDVLESAWPLPRRNRPVLLHGDFWPGNTLWKDGRLVAVIDWEDAAIGDPLADVANARLELLWALGAEAMDEFTRSYQAEAASVDFTDLPYWDLWADLRLAGRTSDWGLEELTEKALQAQHEAFVAQALDKLSAR